jgi:hypothetical protein
LQILLDKIIIRVCIDKPIINYMACPQILVCGAIGHNDLNQMPKPNFMHISLNSEYV